MLSHYDKRLPKREQGETPDSTYLLKVGTPPEVLEHSCSNYYPQFSEGPEKTLGTHFVARHS